MCSCIDCLQEEGLAASVDACGALGGASSMSVMEPAGCTNTSMRYEGSFQYCVVRYITLSMAAQHLQKAQGCEPMGWPGQQADSPAATADS